MARVVNFFNKADFELYIYEKAKLPILSHRILVNEIEFYVRVLREYLEVRGARSQVFAS